MRTNFSSEQLNDPANDASEKILRKCVHCGFCTATCPTYQLLGDERDSPRGRIVLIQDMLQSGAAPDDETVLHLDRCLSCLSCMTTCPSGVNYMHLIDHARAHIAKSYRRPLVDRLIRSGLGFLLPRPRLFGLAMSAARPARLMRGVLPKKMRHWLDLVPDQIFGPQALERPGRYAANGEKKLSVALLLGCVQRPLAPNISQAATRVLQRFGAEVVIPDGLECCGAIAHHMGDHETSDHRIDANIHAIKKSGPIDRVVATASGCGTMLKDYGFIRRMDETISDAAADVAARSKDICEVLDELDYRGNGTAPRLRVAYHAACSLEHGQNQKIIPRALLRAAGFEVVDVPNGHLCCGSAGTYNLLQPEISAQLKANKQDAIRTTRPDVVAAGNIGCMTQLAGGLDVPVVHTVELLDWASGGPMPEGMRR
jgi:glycolate oxidase iron-sulfur subunit